MVHLYTTPSCTQLQLIKKVVQTFEIRYVLYKYIESKLYNLVASLAVTVLKNNK